MPGPGSLDYYTNFDALSLFSVPINHDGSFFNIKALALYCCGPGVLLILFFYSASETLCDVPILNSGLCFKLKSNLGVYAPGPGIKLNLVEYAVLSLIDYCGPSLPTMVLKS